MGAKDVFHARNGLSHRYANPATAQRSRLNSVRQTRSQWHIKGHCFVIAPGQGLKLDWLHTAGVAICIDDYWDGVIAKFVSWRSGLKYIAQMPLIAPLAPPLRARDAELIAEGKNDPGPEA